MKESIEEEAEASVLAADRLAEIDALSRSIRKNLENMRAKLDCSSGPTPKDLQNKLNELHAAHLKVLAAEDMFHEKIGKHRNTDTIDYDVIRVEIGGMLDRLRESLVAEGFPCDAQTRANCNAALPVRLLGDAASDAAEQ